MAKQNRNIIPRFFWYTVAVLLIWYTLSRFDILPSFSNIFKSKPVKIDNTAVFITETKSIAQLMTLSSYNEVVVDSVKITNTSLPVKILTKMPVSSSRLVLIARGRVIAGCNLEKLKPGDIFINKDSVSVKLPGCEILDVISNPSDFEVFSEEGNWSAEEVNSLKVKARNKIKALSLEQQIIFKADEQAKNVMRQFLAASGFKRIAFR